MLLKEIFVCVGKKQKSFLPIEIGKLNGVSCLWELSFVDCKVPVRGKVYLFKETDFER